MKKIESLKSAIKTIITTVLEEGKTGKAGVWQATHLFEDEELIYSRNLAITGIKIPNDVYELQEQAQCDLPWAEDHFRERVGRQPTNPGHTYKYWPYNNFREKGDPYKDGTKFSHTYQERFWPKYAGDYVTVKEIEPGKFKGNATQKGLRYTLGDLDDVITQLKRNPLTRQAYLPIFFPEDTGATHNQRVPCTLGYYFYIEGRDLHINYTIRSCDILRHLRNDLYLTGRLLQYVAAEIGYKPGTMTFIGYHVHVFKNTLYALRQRELKLEK